MHRHVSGTFAFICIIGSLSPGIARAVPPAATPHEFHETLYGRTIIDPFRYMEKMDGKTIAWLEAEGAYTREVLDSIPARAQFERQEAGYSAGFPLIQSLQTYGDRSFYLERPPGADEFEVMEKTTSGTRKLVDMAAFRKAQGGVPCSVDFMLASPDGDRVAVGISTGGSEASELYVYAADSGRLLGGPIKGADLGLLSWSGDGAALYFNQLDESAAAGEDKTRASTVLAWDLHSQPKPVIGQKIAAAPAFRDFEVPELRSWPGSAVVAAINHDGVANELAISLAPAPAATMHGAYRPFVSRADGVTDIQVSGRDIFLLSHKDAPDFQVLTVKAGQPMSSARVLIPGSRRLVVGSIAAASDALYILAREGVYSHLLRVLPNGTRSEVALPFHGHLGDAFTDPRKPGIDFSLESWNRPKAWYRYDPRHGGIMPLGLDAPPRYDPRRFVLMDLQARARDGVRIPLSLVKTRDFKRPGVLLIEAYGSYGISELPQFNPRATLLIQQQVAYAACHVRGGGELGEAWRLAGKGPNKPNTWHDLIACARYLIARGDTDPKHLFLVGGSAGGIAVGRAMTDRPDLFAGVIDAVPEADTLRAEFSQNGPPNIPEFGSIKTRQGFEDLLEMDSYQHVRKGVQYPAVLVTTGLNDPRVAPWLPAKLVAQLQYSGTSRPVLLRVEAEGGHGAGATKSQEDEEFADYAAFILWRSGRAGWQPAKR